VLRGRSARSEVEASEPQTAQTADRSNLILCNLCRPRFSPSWPSRGSILTSRFSTEILQPARVVPSARGRVFRRPAKL